MKEKPTKQQVRRKVNLEILRSLREGELAPEDLMFLNPQELFDVIQYLSQLPFNIDAPKPSNAEFNQEWTRLYRRVLKELQTNETPFSDLKSVTKTLFGDSVSSVTLYLLMELISRYFNEIGSILYTFQSSEVLLESVSDSIKDMISQLDINEGTRLVKAPLELGAFRLRESLELKRSLEIHKEESDMSIDDKISIH